MRLCRLSWLPPLVRGTFVASVGRLRYVELGRLRYVELGRFRYVGPTPFRVPPP